MACGTGSSLGLHRKYIFSSCHLQFAQHRHCTERYTMHRKREEQNVNKDLYFKLYRLNNELLKMKPNVNCSSAWKQNGEMANCMFNSQILIIQKCKKCWPTDSRLKKYLKKKKNYLLAAKAVFWLLVHIHWITLLSYSLSVWYLESTSRASGLAGFHSISPVGHLSAWGREEPERQARGD